MKYKNLYNKTTTCKIHTIPLFIKFIYTKLPIKKFSLFFKKSISTQSQNTLLKHHIYVYIKLTMKK